MKLNLALKEKIKLKAFVTTLFLISTVLSGCVAAVVVGAAAGLVYDRRSLSTLEADARIFHITHKAIIANPEFRNSRILVTSFNRIVLLVGQVSSSSTRLLAEHIAQDTPGVGRVYNEVTISHPLALSQRSKDSLITGQVRSNMLARKDLESGSIRVVTENGVVYLMGIVTPGQAALAVDVARRVNEVQKVIKIFQYIR